MKIRKLEQVEEFLDVVKKCSGGVELRSVYGDVFNLKSTLTQYVAIGALVNDSEEDLELFCYKKEDEELFFQFFQSHPDLL